MGRGNFTHTFTIIYLHTEETTCLLTQPPDMKILVFMSDNRPIDSNIHTANYNSLVAYINKAYCNKHGYDFVYIQPYYKNPELLTLDVCKDSNGKFRHASWAKLLATQHCYNTMSYDYVVYIDSDCIFKNFDISLESVITNPIYKDINIIYASNLPWHQLPCAGFFIMKVNNETKKFIESWYNYNLPLYESIEWKNTVAMATKYCAYDWKPDTHWEQDALWCMIANSTVPSFKYIDENSFQENDTQFLRHICHVDLHNRYSYFKQLTEKLVSIHGSYESIISTIHTINLDTSTWDV